MRSLSSMLAIALAGGATAAAQESLPPPRAVRLGVLTDGPAARADVHTNAMLREIRVLLADEFEVEVAQVQGDWAFRRA